jgi:stage V sporulation protein R
MTDWDIKDLEYWDARIREKAEAFGLSCFPQEFELCDHSQMLSAMAYSGMPAHYPHWSYGKSYEKLKTMYDYGVSGLPYEMIENADYNRSHILYTKHAHDGRDLQLDYAERTLAHLYKLWRHEVALDTIINGKNGPLSYNDRGFATKAVI